MPPPPDPYRTLGLARDASLAEVKRAYRQLAKANHPDAAGEAALPRFLAIQAAYDQIVGPSGTGGTGRNAAAGRRPAGPRAPWDADPDRSDATHRAYGGRSRRTRPPGARPTSGPASSGSANSGSASGSPSGSPGGSGSAGPARPRPARGSKKATLGSTSYDGADAEPFEPDWGGASWYGTTSGTYWTLNPKEYADPRKHGPEYQARARRAAAEAAGTSESDEAAATAAADPATEGAGPATPSPKVPPTHTTTSWWDATAAGPAEPPPPTVPSPPPGRPAWPAEPGVAGHPVGWDMGRVLEPASGGLAGRVGRGVIGWAPIALGIGWLAGEVTGCARFAASCDASSAPIAWFAQVVVLALLLIVPRLAVAASIATIGALAAAIPGSLLVTSMGAAADVGSARMALGALLVIGWSVGIAIGIGREVRRLRDPRSTPTDDESGPVS